MSLPVAQTLPPAADYLYGRLQLDWARHVATETTLDYGTAFTSTEFNALHDANRFVDASVPPGVGTADVIEAVDAHCTAQGTRCLRWALNPSVDPSRTAPLAAELLARGYRPWTQKLMRLRHATNSESPVADVAVLPARAAYDAVRVLARESAAGAGVPQLADAFEAHLDDSHYDVLLALDTSILPRRAVGRAGLLTAGDTGLLAQVFVTPSHRGRGIARLLVARVLGLAGRAGLRHIVLSHEAENDVARRVYSDAGFVDAGDVTQYLR